MTRLPNGHGPNGAPRNPVGPIAEANPLAPTAVTLETREYLMQDAAGNSRTVRRVVKVVEHAKGTFVTTIDPDPADQIAAQLVEHAKLARSGLIVPGS